MTFIRNMTRRASMLAVASFALTACSTSDKDRTAVGADSTASTGQPMAGMSDTGMKGMSASGGMGDMKMTGDADRDFLRMMSDHHKGLIAMAHGAKKMKLAVAADARKLDTKQDAELDAMVTMLEKQFKDPYSPKIMPRHQAMVDALRAKTGYEYQKSFLQNTVQHHQEGVRMIDDYLPKSGRPELKAMAEKMKAEQTMEIAEFQRKIAKL